MFKKIVISLYPYMLHYSNINSRLINKYLQFIYH